MESIRIDSKEMFMCAELKDWEQSSNPCCFGDVD